MQFVRYNPFDDLETLDQGIDKLWQNWRLMPSLRESSPMDIYEENGNLVVKVTLPNFSKGEVKVSTDEGVLEISAEHTEKDEDKSKRRYLLRESSNRYLRHVTLPEGVKADKTKANFSNGTLTVLMPKQTPKKVKAVEVK
jgi:HSP20 family protein